MSRKIIIQFTGYSCSGKSTMGKLLREKFPGMYHVAYDKQKWLLSGYHRNTDSKIIKQIVLGLLKTVCELGLPINLEYFRTEEEYEMVQEIAQQYGYKLYVFHLTAPYEVLFKRFHERVENAEASGSKISMTTDEVFNENYQKGYFTPANSIVFDTAKVSPEEILTVVLKEIEN